VISNRVYDARPVYFRAFRSSFCPRCSPAFSMLSFSSSSSDLTSTGVLHFLRNSSLAFLSPMTPLSSGPFLGSTLVVLFCCSSSFGHYPWFSLSVLESSPMPTESATTFRPLPSEFMFLVFSPNPPHMRQPQKDPLKPFMTVCPPFSRKGLFWTASPQSGHFCRAHLPPTLCLHHFSTPPALLDFSFLYPPLTSVAYSDSPFPLDQNMRGHYSKLRPSNLP